MNREEAINYLTSTGLTEEQVMEVVEALEQKPKTGHWIRHVEDWEWWECSECHSIRAYGNEYCPDCGSHNEDVRNKLKIREVKK